MRPKQRRPPAGGRLLTVSVLALCLWLITGCDNNSSKSRSPEAALAAAKKNLDATSGVAINLHTDTLPPGVDGVTDATGVGTHAPAFDGKLTVLVHNLSVRVPVVSVDGKVHAQLPFTTEFVEIDPSEYGAPDPADLMDPSGGISSWLTAAKGVTQGNRSRDGDTVVTSYHGTVPGTAVAGVIPSASTTASFPTTFRIDDKDRLVGADITGPFYGRKGNVDYTLALTGYGTSKTIKAP